MIRCSKTGFVPGLPPPRFFEPKQATRGEKANLLHGSRDVVAGTRDSTHSFTEKDADENKNPDHVLHNGASTGRR